MKTIQQIQNKINQLKAKLDSQIIYENFGENEQHELNNFIGDIWQYEYSDRLKIIGIQRLFSQWCSGYTYIPV